MPLNTKMELHDTPTSKLVEIKAVSPVILSMVTTNTLPMTSVKSLNFCWIIYVRFGGQLFQQIVGIPMGTNCVPLLADLSLYSYENEFLDKLIKEGRGKLARKFNLSYRYIDDLISFNNKRFKEFISDIYPKELTISETTESTSIASYLDLLFI